MITIGVATVTTAAQAQIFICVEKHENKGLFRESYKALDFSFNVFLLNQQPYPFAGLVGLLAPCICCETKCTRELSSLRVNQTSQESLAPPFLLLACSLLTFLYIEKRKNNIVL